MKRRQLLLALAVAPFAISPAVRAEQMEATIYLSPT